MFAVTSCSWPKDALVLIRNSDTKFDIVITEVNFSPDMINGIKFLETIVRETDLPVVSKSIYFFSFFFLFFYLF